MTVYRKIPLMLPEEVLGYLASMSARRRSDTPSLIAKAIEKDVRADAKRLRKQDPYEPRPALQHLDSELTRARREGFRAPHHDQVMAARARRAS